MSSVDDVLRLAAETLEENPDRWMRGEMYWSPENGLTWEYDACRACVLGMVGIAASVLRGDPGGYFDRFVAQDEAEQRFYDRYGEDLATFNDMRAESARDVAARLRSLINEPAP